MLIFRLIAVLAFTFLAACQTASQQQAAQAKVQTPAATVENKKEVQPVKETVSKQETKPAKKEPETAIDPDVLYLLLTGETALQRQQYDVAMEAYLEASKRVNDVRIAEKAAKIGLYLDDLSKTEKAAQLWLDKDSKNITARRILISAALSKKDGEVLTRQLNAILKENPADFEALLTDLQKTLKSKEDIKFVFKILDELAIQHPKQASIYLLQTILAVRQNDLDLARDRIRKALVLQPKWEKALELETELFMHAGKLAFKQKKYAEALSWFDKVTYEPSLFDAAMAAVSVLFEQQKFTEAAARLDTFLEKMPKQRMKILIMQAELYNQQKKYQQAYDILSGALEETPNEREILYARALTAERMDRIADLEADLHKILANDPNDVGALNALGYTLTDRTNRYEEAEKYLQKALKMQPEEAVIIDSYGWLQFKKGNLQKALEYLQLAHDKLAENEITAHLAEVLWVLNRKAEAEKLIKEAMQKTPVDEYLLDFQQRILNKK